MAKLIGIFLLISSILIAMPSSNHARKQGSENAWYQNICQGKEKVVKLHFYLQDQFIGENQTVYTVANASITSDSPTDFGKVQVADSPLTALPDINSEKVGRVQGLVTYADLTTTALAMNLNFVFTSGKYNGSTISILGRNQIVDEVRELPIVGGTGVFRFARGYAITSTIIFDTTSRGILEYTLYVTYVGDSNTSVEADM